MAEKKTQKTFTHTFMIADGRTQMLRVFLNTQTDLPSDKIDLMVEYMRDAIIDAAEEACQEMSELKKVDPMIGTRPDLKHIWGEK